MKTYEFSVNGGMTADNGKPNWPSILTLCMSKRQALEMIGSLAAQIAESNGEEICFTHVGELTEAKETE